MLGYETLVVCYEKFTIVMEVQRLRVKRENNIIKPFLTTHSKLVMNSTCDLLKAVLDPDKVSGSHFRYFQKRTFAGASCWFLVMDYSLLMKEISFQTAHRQIKQKTVIELLTRNSVKGVTIRISSWLCILWRRHVTCVLRYVIGSIPELPNTFIRMVQLVLYQCCIYLYIIHLARKINAFCE